MKVGFIGLGKLGKPCAETMTERGILVCGYDSNMSRISTSIDIKATLAEAVIDQDIVFIAVPTPHIKGYDGRDPISHLPPMDFDYSILKSVVKECNALMNEGQLLVIISTVLPGTIRREIAPLVNQTNLLYNPYLIAMGTVKQDLLDPEMIMIGTEQGQITWQASMLQNLYHFLLNKSVRFEFGTWEETEAMKIFYNTFISTKLSLVNMMQDVAQKLGHMNVDRVTTALANSTRRIMSNKYMKAGMGDGGSCHPRDNIALRWLAQELNLGYDLFAAVMEARERQAENMALEILKYGKTVFFSSNVYKSGTDLTDGSYSLLVQHYIKKHGGLIASQPDDNTEVVIRVHESDNIVDNGKTIIFDTWRSYPSADNVVYYGNKKGRH
jgi:UDPglucose 6-dehydrogenase